MLESRFELKQIYTATKILNTIYMHLLICSKETKNKAETNETVICPVGTERWALDRKKLLSSRKHVCDSHTQNIMVREPQGEYKLKQVNSTLLQISNIMIVGTQPSN